MPNINPTPTQKNICAIIITYHPDYTFADRLKLIARQVDKVLVIDNASSDDEKVAIKLACENSDAFFISNSENLGIATALNIGIENAIQLGYEWVILFDQDSTVNENLISHLCVIYSAIQPSQNIGILSARYQNPIKRSKPSKNISTPWIEVKRTITSGSMIPVQIFEHLGKFRDDFFIDYVDLEFCRRLIENGYSIIKTTNILMSHPVGQQKFHRFLFKKIRSTNHAADRRYYIARNHIAMLREQNSRTYLWLYPCLKKATHDALTVLLYEKSKWEKVKAILEGIKDGLKQKMGKRSPT